MHSLPQVAYVRGKLTTLRAATIRAGAKLVPNSEHPLSKRRAAQCGPFSWDFRRGATEKQGSRITG